jgi:hypothetical protein
MESTAPDPGETAMTQAAAKKAIQIVKVMRRISGERGNSV